AFVDGKPVNAFVGALPEAQLRSFIDKIIPNPSEIQRRKAARLRAAGDLAGAASSLRSAIALDPESDTARIDLVSLLLEQTAAADAKPIEEAKEVLDHISRRNQADPAIAALRTRLEALEASAQLPSEADLQARIQADGADLQARLDLANRLIAERRFEPALQHLLAIV